MIDKLVIYTDLDGTLLDHFTYDFHPALPLIRELTARNALIIPVTSKTRAETLDYMAKIGLNGPLVVENGAAVFLPLKMEDMLDTPLPPDAQGTYLVREFGRPVAAALAFLDDFCAENKLEIKTFARMTPKEIGQLTNMNESQAALARKRSYDLPFIMTELQENIIRRLEHEAGQAGLKLHQGGRFLHLSSKFDKAGAVSWLQSTLEKSRPGCISIGLGDAENDLEMLALMDYSWLVLSPDADRTKALAGRLPRARVTKTAGPLGWREAVEKTIESIAGGHHG